LLLELKKYQSQLDQIETALRTTELYSPVDGYVQEISSLNRDDYLFSNQEVLKIVPDTDLLYRIELKIPAKNAGKLQTGMKVKLRFPAFPYFEFRGAMGTIQSIDPDAIASSNGELFFTVLTNIDRSILFDTKGIEYPIRVGLQAEARIVLESKTVLMHLLRKMDFLL
jgi:multidrug efflux pump subunit AcrA (membrane-fusion protein)